MKMHYTLMPPGEYYGMICAAAVMRAVAQLLWQLVCLLACHTKLHSRE